MLPKIHTLPHGKIYVQTLVCVTLLLGGYLIGRAAVAQPHMRAALEHLRAAKVELQTAEADKGGHRVKAIALVNDAIAEVEAGMEVGAMR